MTSSFQMRAEQAERQQRAEVAEAVAAERAAALDEVPMTSSFETVDQPAAAADHARPMRAELAEWQRRAEVAEAVAAERAAALDDLRTALALAQQVLGTSAPADSPTPTPEQRSGSSGSETRWGPAPDDYELVLGEIPGPLESDRPGPLQGIPSTKF